MSAAEAELRTALQAIFNFGDGYPDAAAINRIAHNVHEPEWRGRGTTWIGGAAAGLAAVAIAAAAIMTLLSSPHGAVPAARPTPHPTVSGSLANMWSYGITTGDGLLHFDAHNLPAKSVVKLSIKQGTFASELLSTTANSVGELYAGISMPSALVAGTAEFTMCVTPAAGVSITCQVMQMTIIIPSGSTPAQLPTCLPGGRVTTPPSPLPDGSTWRACLGQVTPGVR